jgi:Transposase IS66 family
MPANPLEGVHPSSNFRQIAHNLKGRGGGEWQAASTRLCAKRADRHAARRIGRAAPLPLYELIKAHVFAAERIHGEETTVPVLAKVKTRTGRLWTYVRDDQPT